MPARDIRLEETNAYKRYVLAGNACLREGPRGSPRERHVHKMHVNEMHAYEMYACERGLRERYTYEIHASEMRALCI